MAIYPIKMLKDEQGNPFIPLVSPSAVQDPQGTDWESLIDAKLDKTSVIDNLTSTSSTDALSANMGKELSEEFDNYVAKSGGTMSGQLSLQKTSYQCNEGAIPGTREVPANTLDDVFANVRYSNGLMGSFQLKAAYTLDEVTIPVGWYNYLYIPHRVGGLDGGVKGDNGNYGNLLVLGMTVSGAYVVRWHNATINEIHKLY